MRTNDTRRHGRQRLRCGIAVALAALTAPSAVAVAAPLDAPVDRFHVDLYGGTLTPGVDGAMWALGSVGGGPSTLRIAPDGSVSTFGRALTSDVSGPPTTMLADGSLARLRAGDVVRVSPSGLLSSRPLPTTVTVSNAAAIAADGSVWTATTCSLGATAPRIVRIAADGRVSRWRLSQRPCQEAGGAGKRTALAIGGDGSVWVANGCQGRLARVTIDGRLRQWRSGPVVPHCNEDDWTAAPIALHPDADGGLRYAGGRVTPAGRLIRDASIFVPEVVTPDGSGWQVDTSVRQQLPDGRTREIRDFGSPLWRAMGNAVVGADGNLWLTVGWIFSGRGFYSAEQVQVARVTPTGEVATTPLLPPSDGSLPAGSEALPWPPPLAVGSDAPVWATPTVPLVTAQTVGLTTGLTRVGWSGGAPPAPVPRLAIPRTIARSGPRTWLQLACDVRPGRYCVGTVKLVRRDGTAAARSTARFAVPGGERRPALLRLRLRAAERRALRRGHALRLTAVATVAGGGEQRRAVTIPPRA